MPIGLKLVLTGIVASLGFLFIGTLADAYSEP